EQPERSTTSPMAAPTPPAFNRLPACIVPSVFARPNYISPTVADPRLRRRPPSFRPHGANTVLWRIVLEARKQQMVLPDSVDAQILACIALTQKAAPLEQTNRSRIGRDAGRL